MRPEPLEAQHPMPCWACRLVLVITAMRVERLQAVTEADGIAEGAAPQRLPDLRFPRSHARAANPMAYANNREILADL